MLTDISNNIHRIFEKLLVKHFSKEGFTKYFLNIQWVAISKIFTLVFSLVTTIIVARILGPVTFGTLNYVLSLVGLFGIIASLGIDNVVYKEVTLNKEKRLEIFGSAIFLKIITGSIAFICVLIMLYFSNESDYVKKISLVFALSFITQPLILLSYDFLKDSEAKYVTIAQIITMFISNISKILVIFFFHSLVGFVFILVLENIIYGSIYILQTKFIKNRSIKFLASKNRILSILYLSLPLTLYSAFSEIYARIDQIMLKHYLDITAVGLYAAAVRLTEIWYVIPNILMGALFPAFINSHSDSKEYNKRFKIFILTLSFLSISISLINLIFNKFFVTLIYGKEFIAASPILAIYIFSLFGSFLSFVIYQDLFIKNKIFIIILIPLFTAILNIVLNIYLIPLKGSAGAALATVISYNVIPFLYLGIKKYIK